MDKFKTALKVILIVLVLLLVSALVVWLIVYLNTPQGLYITYNGSSYGTTPIGSSSGGISVPYNSAVTFTIECSDGWGVYSVEDCTVKIVPNVDESHDFEFTVGDDYKSSLYSSESDLSAAFCDDYDGKSIPVSDDGTFTIMTDKLDMSDVLGAVYSESVSIDGSYLLIDYPYIALSVTSPDGGETLTIPFLYEMVVEDIEVVPDRIIF